MQLIALAFLYSSARQPSLYSRLTVPSLGPPAREQRGGGGTGTGSAGTGGGAEEGGGGGGGDCLTGPGGAVKLQSLAEPS